MASKAVTDPMPERWIVAILFLLMAAGATLPEGSARAEDASRPSVHAAPVDPDAGELQSLMRSNPEEAIRRLAYLRGVSGNSGRGPAVGLPAAETPANRSAEFAVVDLEGDYSLFDRARPLGAEYLGKKNPNVVVRLFDKVEGVTERDVRELARLNELLLARGLPVARMAPVRTSDGRWGVRMPWVAGEPLGELLRALNPRSELLTDARALAVRDKALWTLRLIDEVTERETGARLAARRGGSGGEDGLEGFVASPDAADGYAIVDLEPIDMGALRRRLADARPELAASATAGASAAR